MDLTLDQALQKGVEAHKAGKVQEADRYYTAILKSNPKHPDANHNMGVLAVGVGKVDQALPFFKTALEANPKIAQFWLSYVDALIKLNRMDDAKSIFDKAKSHGAKGDGFDKLEQKFEDVNGSGTFKNSNRKDSVHKKLQFIIDLYDQGQLQKVINTASELLVKAPGSGSFVLYNIIGAANKGLGNLDDAIEAYKKAIVIKPDFVEAYNNMGVVYKKQGKLEEALELYYKAININPDYSTSYNNIGNILQEQGKLDEALEAYNKAIDITPDDALAYNNIGACLKGQGKLDEALVAYSKSISIKPDYAEAHHNMGNVLNEQGKLDEAVQAYTKALSIQPDNSETNYNMGNVLNKQGKLDEAIQAYIKALSIKHDYAEAYSNMGTTLKDQGNLEEAIEAYKKAISIRPSLSDAWSNGADVLEKWNKLDQLKIWLEKAFNSFEVIPADLSYMKAQLLWRNQKFEETFSLISDINFEAISEIRKKSYLELKAKCFEKFEKFDEAYHCFDKSNSIVKNSKEYLSYESEQYFQNLKDKLAKLKLSSKNNIKDQSTENPDFMPVFLVGFPRSGTTLLDAILRSNSRINVVEEQGMLLAAGSFLKKNGFNDFVGQLVSSKLNLEAQKIYRREFYKHIDTTKIDKINIDKLPLNLLEAPLIHQLYPNAKFILALRHPMDTILSCWMQNFKLNAPMANMVDLERIVDFYCIAMETFKICRTYYNLAVHEIRYEDLINNFQKEAEAVVQFLNLQWEPEMENYQDTALNRGRINTPSYSQVVQPIYKDAQYRWLNYRKYLEQYLDQVKPWIAEYGYD